MNVIQNLVSPSLYYCTAFNNVQPYITVYFWRRTT